MAHLAPPAALSDNQDKVPKFMHMFSEAGKKYRMLILQHSEMFILLVQAISECAACPDLFNMPILVLPTLSTWACLNQPLGNRREVREPEEAPPAPLKVYEGTNSAVILWQGVRFTYPVMVIFTVRLFRCNF